MTLDRRPSSKYALKPPGDAADEIFHHRFRLIRIVGGNGLHHFHHRLPPLRIGHAGQIASSTRQSRLRRARDDASARPPEQRIAAVGHEKLMKLQDGRRACGRPILASQTAGPAAATARSANRSCSSPLPAPPPSICSCTVTAEQLHGVLIRCSHHTASSACLAFRLFGLQTQ